MEVSGDVRLTGLKELDDALRGISAEVRGPIMRDALKAGGEVIREGAAKNIHSRSGQTAAELNVEIQIGDEEVGGAAAIGAIKGGRPTKRNHILNFLEFGTKAHNEPKRRGRLRRFEARAGKSLKSINAAKRVAFGGRVFSRVHHPGIQPQAPLTNALADQAGAAIEAFIRTAWRGIEATAVRFSGKAGG
jgi:HK97 gp10 family phage protein